MADNIIKVNFGEANIITNEEIELKKVPHNYGGDDDPTLARFTANNLKVRLAEIKEGEFTVCVDQVSPWRATFRKTTDFWAAWELFTRLLRHVYDGDRTYDELVIMLNNEIKWGGAKQDE